VNIDLLTVEIGSTITKVNAWDNINSEITHIGQSTSLTTVNLNDVTIGVENAVSQLEKSLKQKIVPSEILINSSAAGGLKIAVFGLTHDMTVRAAREASLGAGAIIKYIGVGKIQKYIIKELKEAQPAIIILSGGVDFGETDITLHNAEILSAEGPDIPYIYAGNTKISRIIKEIFENNNKKITITENVYPNIDELNIDPCREIIQHTFSEHIIHASGMEKLSQLTSKEIIPTPYAVMKTAEYIYKTMGNVIIFDVGGATTDVHSVTEDSPENSVKRTEPEPLSKRTVEGDLGVYVNAENLNEIKHKFFTDKIDLSNLKPMPDNIESVKISSYLAQKAVNISMTRHAGVKKNLFTPTGKKSYVKGRDLTAVKYVIGTGGALTKLPGALDILKNSLISDYGEHLVPPAEVVCGIDKNYIFSSLGTIIFHYKNINIKNIIKNSLKHNSEEQ